MRGHIASLLVCTLVAVLVLLPFGYLCIWASYRLGRRLRLTDQFGTLALGLLVFPLPFEILFMVVLYLVQYLLHLPHVGQSVGGASPLAAGSGRGQRAWRTSKSILNSRMGTDGPRRTDCWKRLSAVR